MALTAAEVTNLLTQHDRVRRTTDIPLFYGEASKDSITATQLITRLERAARIANWNNDQVKCDQFFLSLRGEADKWARGIEEKPNFDANDWEAVKREFLAAFASKYTALAVCTTLQSLKQKTDETVQVFYNRLLDTFSNAKYGRPANILQYQGDDAGRTIPGAAAGDPGTVIPDAMVNALTKSGAEQMEWYLKMIMFVGGLHEKLRDEVLQRNPQTMDEALDEARKQELILKEERKVKGSQVVAVKEEEDEILEIAEDEVEQVEAVNAIRRRQGQRTFRYRVRRRQGGNRCYNCNRVGHFAKDCRLPKRNPFPNKRVSGISEQNPYETQPLN
jgi:hypothetical protein